MSIQLKEQLIQWRRHLHQYPELSFHEVETAAFVENVLKTLPNIEVETGVGYPTAVVATLSSGVGPTFAIRADMDALPILEQNAVSYQSKHRDVMHACGHDAHTSIVLGAAHLLSECFAKKELTGTVKFIFQPAEEHVDEKGFSGAPYMIRAGVLDDVDGVIALHMNPESPLGEVWVHDGYSMANVDVFKGIIEGTGGHGAYPHLGTDPFWMLSFVLQALYGLTGRKISPLESAIVSIGKINGGTTSNVIPRKVEIEGTIRSYEPMVRNKLLQQVEEAFSLVEGIGGQYDLTFIQEDPALYNHPVINELIRKAIVNVYPEFQIVNTSFGLGGEDFAHMTKKVPGAMFFLGCSKMDNEVRNLHTPLFDIDEEVLSVGANIFAEVTKLFLTRK